MSEWVKAMVDIIIQYGGFGLFIVSFAESSIFPIPPDLILIPLSIINHELALFYAALTTFASVIGGLFGYYIGAKAGRPILMRFFAEGKIKKVEEYFIKYGGWAVAIAGLTPIPYKLFTIASGVFKVRKSVFVNASILGRGIRFFLEGAIIYMMGDQAQRIISEYFDVLTIGMAVVGALAYSIYYLFKKKKSGENRILNEFFSRGISNNKYAAAVYKKLEKNYGRFIFLILSIALMALSFEFLFLQSQCNFLLYIYILTIIFIVGILLYAFIFRDSTTDLWSFKFFIKRAIAAEIVILALAAGLAYEIGSSNLVYMDKAVNNWIIPIRNTSITGFMEGVSFFASSAFLPFAFIFCFYLLAFRCEKPKAGFVLLINILGANIIKILTKNIFKRARPEYAMIIEKEYSFPSGHALIGFAFYTMLAYMVFKYYKGPWKRIITGFLIIFPIIISFSRLYLGVHYASDVFAGLLLGTSWLIFGICIDKYFFSHVLK